jgi:hypothetical protein
MTGVKTTVAGNKSLPRMTKIGRVSSNNNISIIRTIPMMIGMEVNKTGITVGHTNNSRAGKNEILEEDQGIMVEEVDVGDAVDVEDVSTTRTMVIKAIVKVITVAALTFIENVQETTTTTATSAGDDDSLQPRYFLKRLDKYAT